MTIIKWKELIKTFNFLDKNTSNYTFKIIIVTIQCKIFIPERFGAFV